MRRESGKRTIKVNLLIALLVMSATLLQACDNDRRPREEPRSGGMVVTTETPAAPSSDAGSAADTATPVPPEPTPTPEPTPAPPTVGQVMIGAMQVRLYADATSSAPILEVYEPGGRFTIMESDAADAPYPRMVAGMPWLRVRAADGLAGWVKAESLTSNVE